MAKSERNCVGQTEPRTNAGCDRTAREVLDDHLACRVAGDIEGDIRNNYDKDVVILTMEGCFRGANEVRGCRQRLMEMVGPADYSFPVKRVEDRFALLEWRARCGERSVEDGADSFVIENGRIVCQTIRYTVQHRQH